VAEERNVFLRWAQLKQASKEGGDTEVAPTDSEETAALPVANGASDEPFDLASLPSIESIAAHTDVTAFLRAGVPAELTRAALRRVWSSDPAIRDFIGIAENQWDFNDPNAIPGFGPLDPTENVAELLGQVSRRLEQVSDALADVPSPSNPIQLRTDDSVQPVLGQSNLTDQPLLADVGARPNEEQNASAQPGEAYVESVSNSPRRRRHGSALPQ
jgi:Protein of unknown function (DUF3306)